MAFLDNSGVTALVTRLKNYFALKEEKQDTLVSGTNIKTINGESLLGSGDITVGGGGGDSHVIHLYYTLTEQGSTKVFTLDKTAREIYDLIHAGNVVFVQKPDDYTISWFQVNFVKLASPPYRLYTLNTLNYSDVKFKALDYESNNANEKMYFVFSDN